MWSSFEKLRTILPHKLNHDFTYAGLSGEIVAATINYINKLNKQKNMSYIQQNLMEGEELLYRSKLHWVIFLGPIIFTVVAFIFFASKDEGYNPGGLLLFIAIIWGMVKFITLKTSEFGMTNKRVLMKVGWIRRSSIETLLPKIESIRVDQSILGRILNYGTIIVKGVGGTSNPFPLIEKPLEFRKKVQEQLGLEQKN